MTTILAWSDGGSACEYYRLRVPLEHMNDNDPSLDIKIDALFQTFGGEVPDVIIGQRVHLDGPSELWRRLDREAYGKRPRLVYEIDDDLFNVPMSNPAGRWFSDQQTQDNIRECMARADVITVSTEKLGERVRHELGQASCDRWFSDQQLPEIMVIPNALPDIAYEASSMPKSSEHRTIGWAGTSSHVHDFDEVARPLGRYLKRNPNSRFHAIGYLFGSVRRHAPASQLELTSWVHDMPSYYKALDQFDVGIIPLRPGVFNQSKSDVKLLEYAARGIPIIASDAGPYSTHAGIAMLARAEYEWSGYLATAAGFDEVKAAYDYSRSRDVRSTAEAWRTAVLGAQA